MRVLFCKSFFKSSLCIYSPCAIDLEDAHHVSSSLVPVSPVVKEKTDGLLKSSMKKSQGLGKEEACKGRVKWMDLVGKELAEIREFEPIESSESDDKENASSQTCICAIQ